MFLKAFRSREAVYVLPWERCLRIPSCLSEDSLELALVGVFAVHTTDSSRASEDSRQSPAVAGTALGSTASGEHVLGIA